MDYKYDRYAVVWYPAHGSALSEFGVGWTGWCPERGVHADPAKLPKDGLARSAMPQHQAQRGLIANIRSPFRLAEGRSRWSLERALDALAQATPVIDMPDMVPMVVGGRVLVAPNRTPAAVAGLIEKVGNLVRLFQAVPAPATPSSRPRKTEKSGDKPPVAETFHMPLTGKLDVSVAEGMAHALGPAVTPLFDKHPVLDDIALMGDPGEGRPWRLVDRYRLHADASRWGIAPMPLGMACPDVPPAAAVSESNWDTVLA